MHFFIGDTSLRKYTPKYIKPTINRNKITWGCKTYISDMLLQSNTNKSRIPQLSKIDKLYINYASTILLKIPKNNYIEHKKHIFLNDSQIHLRYCDAASSYHCIYPIIGSKIPKWDCILKCCSDFPMINDPFLESSEQLDRLFPVSLHKIKFHIFQNLSKCSINGLRPFKYNNICELCDIIPDKYKKSIIMLKKYFVLHEEVIDVLHEMFYTLTIENVSFHIAHVRILGSMECGKTRNYCFRANA